MTPVRRSIPVLALFLAATLVSACEDVLVGADPEPTPVNAFEDLWQGFDRYCANFGSRGVDWDSVYAEFRPRVSDSMSDGELFDVLREMLLRFRDPHVWLKAPRRSFYTLDSLIASGRMMRNFNKDLVMTKYLRRNVQVTGGGRVWFGRLPGVGIDEDPRGSIGYVYVSNFKGGRQDDWYGALDAVLDSLRDTRGLIVDLRDNTGGNGMRARDFAGRFADRERLWMTTQTRDGHGRDSFTEPYEHFVRPTGDWQYRRPVAVLTSRFTISAGELFTLAMRELPHVTVVGDTTMGTTGSVHERVLVNGWAYALSYQRTFAADGVNYDGRGVPPDVLRRFTFHDLGARRDPILETGVRVASGLEVERY